MALYEVFWYRLPRLFLKCTFIAFCTVYETWLLLISLSSAFRNLVTLLVFVVAWTEIPRWAILKHFRSSSACSSKVGKEAALQCGVWSVWRWWWAELSPVKHLVVWLWSYPQNFKTENMSDCYGDHIELRWLCTHMTGFLLFRHNCLKIYRYHNGSNVVWWYSSYSLYLFQCKRTVLLFASNGHFLMRSKICLQV